MYKKMDNYLVRLEKEHKTWKRYLKALGRVRSGNFVSARDGAHTKWYLTCNGKREYIPKRKRELAKRLAEHKYLEARLAANQKEQRAVQLYLKNHCDIKKVDERFLAANSPYRELISDKYSRLTDELVEWQHASFASNSYHHEKKKYHSHSGNFLRSKSELLIDLTLYEYGIPFRYECELMLRDGSVVYPDFTVRRLSDGEVMYYEHFGMMDNPEYFDGFIKKMNQYARNGIYLNQNLFATFETSDAPLSVEDVERVITKFM